MRAGSAARTDVVVAEAGRQVFRMYQADSAGSESRWSYLRVAEQLRQEVLSGIYRPGKRLPGEPALARRFGVGRVTVARALKILEQSNLVFRVRGSGTYVQRDAARGTVNLTIGYLVSDVSMLRNTPAGICLESAHHYLEQCGHTIRLLTRSEFVGGGEPTAAIRRMVRAGALNGLIVNDVLAPDLLHSIAEILPVACGSGDLVPDNVLTVAVDFLLGFYMATMHLLTLGHRKIGLLGGNPTSSVGYRVHQAFRLALQLAEVDPRSCPVSLCGYSPVRTRWEFEQMLKAHPDMTGVICGDDAVAMAAIEALQALGKSVPQQFSVVGCNDTLSDAFARSSLTTLRIDFALVGRQLVDLLLSRIYGREGPTRYYCKPELVVRSTTAPPQG